MKKKRFLYVVAVIAVLLIIDLVPKKPFLKLKKEDIKTAAFTYDAMLTIPLDEYSAFREPLIRT